jgi:hypothetical protein
MITPSFGLTATERVLPRLALDWTTGVAQSGVDVARAGVATFVGSNGLIQSASADTQRIDYSTGTAGLLIEESRTNLFLYSEQFDDAYWTKSRASITANAITAPDGALTGDKLVENTDNNTHAIIRTVTTTNTVANTWSIYAKASERPNINISVREATTFARSSNVTFNLSAGTVGAVANAGGSSGSAVIKNVGDGWYRCSLTITLGGTDTNSQVFFQLNNGTASFYQGNGTSGIFVWGAQLELGGFPTSYIPTEAATVIRNADVATMTGTNFSDWFNASEGTFFAQTQTPVGASGAINRLLSANDGSISNRIEIDTGTNPNTTVLRINASGVNQGTVTVDGVANFQTRRSVFAYKQDAFAMAVNGGAVGEDTSANVPTVDRLLIGASFATGSSYANGLIQKVMYWPYRLTNAEIQAFSK